jgi:hypothetical protein
MYVSVCVCVCVCEGAPGVRTSVLMPRVVSHRRMVLSRPVDSRRRPSLVKHRPVTAPAWALAVVPVRASAVPTSLSRAFFYVFMYVCMCTSVR